MGGRMRWLIRMLIGALPLLAAGCDQVLPQQAAPSTTPPAVVEQAPTRTLGPIVSYTPRFTATPIPSITPTPSDTPIASATPIIPTDTPAPPTPVPTATPTASGVIRSSQTVNLREGPGTNYPVAASVRPGTEVGVIGAQTDSAGRQWYKVAYTAPDGTVQNLWVLASLLTTDYGAVQALTPEPGAEGAGTRVNVLAYCQGHGGPPRRVTTDDAIYIEWSWFVKQQDQMQQHLANAHYTVTLDGKLLSGWEDYAQPIKQEGARWIIYWYYPVGKLSAGQHKVDYEVRWDEAITDGFQDFGPGTRTEVNVGDCTFNVVTP